MNRRDFLFALPCMPLLLKGSRKRIRYFMPRPRAQWLHSSRGRIVFRFDDTHPVIARILRDQLIYDPGWTKWPIKAHW